MRILAIESTCDETGAAVVEDIGKEVRVVSNEIASSSKLQQKYGGVVPEVAAREQIAAIIPVVREAIKGIKTEDIDGVAVASGPGLLGSLLIGVETAKSLAWAWKKPLIGVNHMHGHVLANWIVENEEDETPLLPAVALVVSGGHTELILIKTMEEWVYLGGTRDDAAGECFDKTARIIGLGYPGGPMIAKVAEEWRGRGRTKTIKLPRPMIHEEGYDMSFSGLKAAVAKMAEETKNKDKEWQEEMADEINQAVVDCLMAKTERAAEAYKPKSILAAGGVAANILLRKRLQILGEERRIKVSVPRIEYCTDNAAMIGAAGLLKGREADVFGMLPKPGMAVVD